MKPIDILSMVRSNVKALKPYASAQDEYTGTASVFLDANESPFSHDYNRYPDPHQRELKTEIAGEKKVKSSNIFLGNGSDEAIDLLFRVFCEPGKSSVIIPQPTYGMFSVSAEINDVAIISPLLTTSYNISASTVLASHRPDTKIIFLCSPNNPTGNLLDAEEVKKILNSFNGIVVVDEAYIDFSEKDSLSGSLEHFPNLVILQTFSKAWGLAGLRLGMCFAHELVITLLDKVKPPYNINAFTQQEALKTIRTKRLQKAENVRETIRQRALLKTSLEGLSMVRKVHPSDANFLLVEFTDASNTYSHLARRGIIVRNRSTVILCEGCLRITIGTREENNQLVNALKEL